jgi:hypothetical protein
MSEQRYSPAYLEHRKRGPFPGQVDPWAEAGRYFQQIHAGMIGHILEQIQDSLDQLGYVAGRETSLQIAEGREPDVYGYQKREKPDPSGGYWDYAAAAAEVLAEPGTAFDWDAPSLQGIFITQAGSRRLVTVVEVVSPGNKVDAAAILDYRQRRDRLISREVSIVEIDTTRSVKRLSEDKLVSTYAYHVALYIPNQMPRVVGMDYGDVLKRIALPLRQEVVPVDTQVAYDYAYQVARIAAQINDDDRYGEGFLPFPTQLTESQRREAIDTAAAWRAELDRLRGEGS